MQFRQHWAKNKYHGNRVDFYIVKTAAATTVQFFMKLVFIAGK